MENEVESVGRIGFDKGFIVSFGSELDVGSILCETERA